ncbi:hypothetical protein FACS189485_07130 [Spirochaetia bacterium]|nr:hypothetical protein FACS189485_07130 [Spirochaetia bacterium]
MSYRIKPFILLIAVLSLASACSKKMAPTMARAAMAYDSVESETGRARKSVASEPMAELSDPAEKTRKLVQRASLRIRTADPAAAEKPLLEAMEKYDAWAASTRINENSRDYTIRVPSASYESFLAELNGMGKVLHRNESAEDVSLRYYDLEGQLAVKLELLKTFQGYLGKAKDIDEIMTVEKRIAELQNEIDWTGTQFRSLAHLVDYATIELEILGPINAPSASAPGIGERITGLFSSFGDFASALLVILVGVVIYGIPSLLILILLIWLLFGRIGLLKKLWHAAFGRAGKD